MKEVLQSKQVVESNNSTDVGQFSVHVRREINDEKCNDKVTENEEVDMSSEIEKREAHLATMEMHKKVCFVQ